MTHSPTSYGEGAFQRDWGQIVTDSAMSIRAVKSCSQSLKMETPAIQGSEITTSAGLPVNRWRKEQIISMAVRLTLSPESGLQSRSQERNLALRCDSCGRVGWFLKKLTSRTIVGPGNSTLRYVHRRCSNKTRTYIHRAALFTTARKWKQLTCPSHMNGYTKRVYAHSGVFFKHKKEWRSRTATTCMSPGNILLS